MPEGLPGLPPPGKVLSTPSRGLPGLPPPGRVIADEPSFLSEAGRVSAQAVKGAVDTLGLASDLGQAGTRFFPGGAAVQDIGKALGIPGVGGNLSDIGSTAEQVDTATGLTELTPETPVGRIVGKGAEFLGGAAVPLGAGGIAARGARTTLSPVVRALIERPATQLGAAGAGGLAAGGTEEATGSPLLGGLAGLLTGVGAASLPTTARGVRRTSEAISDVTSGMAPKRAAVEIIEESATDPTNLQQRLSAALRAQPDDELAAMQSTAEVLGDPGLAKLQGTIGRNIDEANVFGQRSAERANLRNRLIEALEPGEAIPKGTAGATIRAEVGEGRKSIKEAVSEAFGAVDPDDVAKISVDQEKTALKTILGKRFDPEIETMNPELNKLLDSVMKGSNKRNYSFIQKARSKALEIQRNLESAPGAQQRNQASLAGDIAEKLDEAAKRAAEGKNGFTKQQADKWLEARKLRVEQAERFEKGSVGRILKRNRQTGEYQVIDERVVDRVFDGTAEATRQLKKAVPEDNEAIKVLKKSVMDSLIEKSRSTDDQLLLSKLKTQLSSKRAGLDELFGRTKVKQLDRIVKDLQSEASINKLAAQASKGQSATDQFGAAGRFLKNVLGGKIAFRHPAKTTIVKLFAGDVTSLQETQINELLVKAATEPKFAAELLKTPTRKRVESLLTMLSRDLTKQAAIQAAELGGDT